MTDPTLAVDWEARFATSSTPWERAELNPAYLGWRASGTLRPGRILVPGAGRSAEPADLARSGFVVTVVDAAESAVAFQRQRLDGDNEVVLSDLFTWAARIQFDAVYDQTCLCALPPPFWPAYAQRLAEWLRPGGVLAILFMQTGQTGGPPFHCDLARMRGLFSADIWQWPDSLPVPVEHPVGAAEQPAALLRR